MLKPSKISSSENCKIPSHKKKHFSIQPSPNSLQLVMVWEWDYQWERCYCPGHIAIAHTSPLALPRGALQQKKENNGHWHLGMLDFRHNIYLAFKVLYCDTIQVSDIHARNAEMFPMGSPAQMTGLYSDEGVWWPYQVYNKSVNLQPVRNAH